MTDTMTGEGQPAPITDQELDDFCVKIERRIARHHKAEGYTFGMPKIRADKGGRKYVRIVRDEAHSRSVIVFIERATGDIWKPAGWKGPEKNFPRGNIRGEEPLKWITANGCCENAR